MAYAVVRKYNNSCSVAGCQGKCTSKGIVNGKRYYKNLCSVHHRERQLLAGTMSRDKCTLCGWIGPCDLHRVIWGKHGGEYVRSNVISVCPNCHRLVHSKRMLVGESIDGQGKGSEQLMLFEKVQMEQDND